MSFVDCGAIVCIEIDMLHRPSTTIHIFTRLFIKLIDNYIISFLILHRRILVYLHSKLCYGNICRFAYVLCITYRITISIKETISWIKRLCISWTQVPTIIKWDKPYTMHRVDTSAPITKNWIIYKYFSNLYKILVGTGSVNLYRRQLLQSSQFGEILE